MYFFTCKSRAFVLVEYCCKCNYGPLMTSKAPSLGKYWGQGKAASWGGRENDFEQQPGTALRRTYLVLIAPQRIVTISWVIHVLIWHTQKLREDKQRSGKLAKKCEIFGVLSNFVQLYRLPGPWPSCARVSSLGFLPLPWGRATKFKVFSCIHRRPMKVITFREE